MSNREFEVDFDAEAVWVDDGWYTRDQLADRIKTMIEGGDYRISRPSAALESLEAALAGGRVLAVRVTPDVAHAFETIAETEGRQVPSLLREALSWWLAARDHAQKAWEEQARAAETAGAPSNVAGAAGLAAQVAAGPVVAAPAAGAPNVASQVQPKGEHVALDDPEIEKKWFAR